MQDPYVVIGEIEVRPWPLSTTCILLGSTNDKFKKIQLIEDDHEIAALISVELVDRGYEAHVSTYSRT
jgi:hypothetical protein